MPNGLTTTPTRKEAGKALSRLAQAAVKACRENVGWARTPEGERKRISGFGWDGSTDDIPPSLTNGQWEELRNRPLPLKVWLVGENIPRRAQLRPPLGGWWKIGEQGVTDRWRDGSLAGGRVIKLL